MKHQTQKDATTRAASAPHTLHERTPRVNSFVIVARAWQVLDRLHAIEDRMDHFRVFYKRKIQNDPYAELTDEELRDLGFSVDEDGEFVQSINHA